ncbi:PTS system mannose/fructose/N-acetylgalactosamine-transporter subunit IIB [Thermophilibacter immobilis]|uniref:PTS sugar transporter subunit IIB n=1 Tax=Thermophilibacter immobilis TaxID=2779519 RepID=A0A7S7M8R6_9ACTN|nr:PTS sugar transporter subunit IIB [Thermophilibacter immobilis]QOY60822.1 PTS sugar transporter subunit IIB [Thermophilibacter immobilis]
MIVQLRVDDRLIHGQVALMWGKELNTKGIVVANDHAASDATQAATLKMACPQGQKLLIRSVDDAVKVVNDPRGGQMRIFALTDSVADALRLAQGAPDKIGSINIANVGRFDRSDEASKVLLTTGVTLNPQELDAARELCKLDMPVVHQVGVLDPKTKVSDLLAKL